MFGNRRKGWIGIEWGTQTLRLAQIERNREEWRVVASAVVTRRHNSSTPQELLSAVPAWSALELRTAISSDPRFSGRTAACVLPMHLTELRQLTIPPGSAAERYAMVSNEIASTQGDAEGDVLFDYWESPGTAPSESSGTINAMSVPCDIVANVTDTMAQARLACEVLDGLPFSLGRAVGMEFGRENGLIAVLDWGRISSTFCLVRNGAPLFTRHLRNCGLARLTDTVSQALALPEEDVTETLATFGLPGDPPSDGRAGEIQAVIAEAAQPHLNEIVEEVRRTIAYIGTQDSGAVPERLCLTGDGATVRHADHFLSSQVSVPVRVWGMPATVADNGAAAAAEMPQLATAIALSALAWTPN
jgi:Tfp pilus assembly PilM family ATPase